MKHRVKILVATFVCIAASVAAFCLGTSADILAESKATPTPEVPVVSVPADNSANEENKGEDQTNINSSNPTADLIHSFLHSSFAASQIGVFSAQGMKEIGENKDIDFLANDTYRELIEREDFLDSMEKYVAEGNLSSENYFTWTIFCEILLREEVMDKVMQKENFVDEYGTLCSIYYDLEVNLTTE